MPRAGWQQYLKYNVGVRCSNANPASLYALGGIFNVSSVERTIMGSIMIVRATLPRVQSSS